MAISLHIPENVILKPTITVFGVGGAGGNAVNNMIESNLKGVRFVAANTDAQSLEQSKAEHKIQLGATNYQRFRSRSKPRYWRSSRRRNLK